MDLQINGHAIIVTGASRGLGAAMARALVAEGAVVLAAARSVDALKSLAAETPGQVLPIACDMRDRDAVADLVGTCLSEFGRVDAVVNNAGIVSPMLHFFDADEAWWRRIIDVNLTGHFLCNHRAARVMAKNGGGSIINMSSGGATRAHRSFTAYGASKGGIEALTRAMALDLGPYNIRVNALMPGSIDTAGMDTEARAYRGVNIPAGRIGDPFDMTGPALFLASDDSSYVTGDVIKVDGGMLAQQRSATVDIVHPDTFPAVEDL